ncbi:MAG: hypothetical protein KDJ52_19450 [Anaerolineae bacterium]|nr:hypothetical protein [Anaerolineae bacterium]
MSQRDEIQELLTRYNRRLQKLKEKEAAQGYNTPPETLTEIEDIEAKVEKLQAESKSLENNRGSMPDRNNTRGIKLNRKQITLLAILGSIAFCVISIATTTGLYVLSDDSFPYLVRVQKDGTSSYVSGAKVTIEVADQAPLDGVTDANGVTRIFLPRSYAGQPGRLLVEAIGYDPYRQEIDLTKGILPNTIPLRLLSIKPKPTDDNGITNDPPALAAETPTPTATLEPPTLTPTPTYTPQPTPSPTNISLPTNTPLPTPTPEFLQVGEPWEYEGVSLILEVNGFKGDRIFLDLRILNRTSSTINFVIAFHNDIRVIDNLGRKYECRAVGVSGCPNTYTSNVSLESGKQKNFDMSWEGPFAESAVTHLLVTANVSRVQGAKWLISVEH